MKIVTWWWWVGEEKQVNFWGWLVGGGGDQEKHLVVVVGEEKEVNLAICWGGNQQLGAKSFVVKVIHCPAAQKKKIQKLGF